MALPLDGYLYDRIYKLTVGKPAIAIDVYKDVVKINEKDLNMPLFQTLDTGTLPLKVPEKVGQNIQAGTGIEITELKMTATISRSLTSLSETGDSTQIVVYNLSPESKAVVETPNAVVMLEAGYVGTGLSLLYSGTVVKAVTVKQGQDKVTTLYCQDGAMDKKAVKVTGALPKGSTVPSVIRSLINAMPGMTVGYVSAGVDAIPAFNKGYSVQGYAKQELDRICRMFNLIWSVTNGVVNVGPDKLKDGSADAASYKTRAIEITPTYIKGSLEPMVDTGVSMTTEPKKPAVKFNTFLEPRLSIDSYVALRGFPDYDGDYRVTSVSHSLDSRGGAWDTTVETERVG